MTKHCNPMKALAIILSVVMLLGMVISPIPKVGAAAAKVSLSKAKLSLTVTKNGTKKTYGSQKLTVKKASGVQVKKAVFSSSAPKVASVTSAGKVTAKSKGSAVITAKVTYKYKKKTKTQKLTCKVSVTEKDVTPVNITLNKMQASIAVTRDGNTINKGTVTLKVNVSSGVKVNKVTYASSDKAVATVNNSGVVTAQKRGGATITATVAYTRNGKSATKKLTCKVTVDQKYKNMIKALKVSQGVYCTFAGNCEGVNPYYQLQDGVVAGDDFYLWDVIEASIADPTVAELGQDGLVIGKKAGNTTITLTAKDGSGVSTTGKLKVYNSREDVPAADDLYNNTRSLYLPDIEAEWTQEEKERYIDKDNNVHWSLGTVAEKDYAKNKKDLIEEYKEKGHQTDNTADDAVASVLSTAELMRTGSGDDAYFSGLKSKVADRIMAAKSTDDLMNVCTGLGKEGVVTLLNTNVSFGSYIENLEEVIALKENTKPIPEDPVDTREFHIPTVSAEKLIDHRYISEDKYPASAKETALKNYIQTMFSYVGINDASMINETVALALECENAPSEDPGMNSITYAQLDQKYPKLKLKASLEAYNYDNMSRIDRVLAANPERIAVIEKYAENGKLDALKGYAIIRALHDFGIYSKKGVEADYELMMAGQVTDQAKKAEEVNTLLTGNLDKITDKLPWDFDQVYTENIYDENFKKETEKILEDYKVAYIRKINNCWMGEKARKNMLAKVEKMRFYSAYPSDGEYQTLRVQEDLKTAAEGGTFADSALALARYRAYLIHLIVGHINYDTAWMEVGEGNPYPTEAAPWTNNAFYQPSNNIAYLCHVGLSQLIESNPENDPDTDAKNIAMMATTIGHELGHAFDNNGSRFNGDGYFQNLWDEKDKQTYQSKVDRLADIYSKTLTYGDVEDAKAYYQDGQLVVGEALADLGGTEVALDIIKNKYQAQKTSAEFEAMVREFYQYTAYQWMGTEHDKMKGAQLEFYLNDVHPLSRQRTNYIASMMDDFYKVFNVKDTDAMYFAPEDRVELWSVN